MKIANINGRAHALLGGDHVDLSAASRGALPFDPMAYVEVETQNIARRFLESSQIVLPSTEVAPSDFGPPIPRPNNILAVALNYHAHVVESHKTVPGEPAVFPKLNSSLCGPFDPIIVPDGCEMIDYEAEVVVVIGKRMRGVAAADVWDHVSGITAGQDVSDRHEQRRPPLAQFSLAKSYDTFSPTGPYLVTLDEFADLNAIEIRGTVNNTEVQSGSTAQLIYSIPDLLAWTCRFVTLEPGDLIFTGTPEGVGARREPPLYLADGFVVETSVPEVGTMRNPVVASVAVAS
ncbi:fumarylacetoacetate hydrolase family protein [Microbacterium sp. A93]|uniref:fumarylacetoacetate hydrolase family protein n=1 Tax=Microbacterium sp. A93 TaxID=3450716 RepID=UPI003F437B48